MSKRLGELLIERGAITADQLETALRNQLMLGGHLGTCLLELGFVDEASLGEALAQAMRAPYAKPDVFQRPAGVAIRSMSRSLVEEFQAIPFRRNDKVLDVAMINPRDLPSVDALASATRCRIVPWVSPEVRIFEAMERFYGIPRRTRYVVISRSLAVPPPAAEPAREPAPPPDAQSTITDSLRHDADYGYGRSWMEIADELAAKRATSGTEHAGDSAELASLLCRANDKDDIARAVLAHALKTVKRAMLFAVKGDDITLWDGAGFDAPLDAAAFKAIKVAELALLDLVLGQDHYRGPLGDSASRREIYARLGVPAPIDILVVPVHINDRLVALFIGDGGPEGRVEGDPREGLRLARMLGLALNMVIFKKKIRNLGSLAGHASS